MTTLVTNNASTTLTASATTTQTAFNLASGTGAEFPQPAAGQHFWATLQNAAGAIEVVQVTAMSGDTVASCVRGADNTTALAWSAGDSFSLRPCAALFNDKMDAATAANTYFPLATGGQLSGKNRIINGDMRVAQYTTNPALSTSTSAWGPCDRWKVQNFGGGGTLTQSQGTISYNNATLKSLVQTATVAASATMTTNEYWSGIAQVIEGFNAYDLIGQPATLSFLFLSNVSGTFSVAVRDGSAANSFVETFSATAGVVTPVSITLPTLPTSLSIPSSTAAGMYLSIGAIGGPSVVATPSNSWQVANAISATTSTNWASTAGNYIAATNIQLEAGANATEFERINYGDALRQCQRYYYFGYTPALISTGGVSYGGAMVTAYFKTTMRAVPSIVYGALTGNATGGITSDTVTTDSIALSFSATQTTGIYYNPTAYTATAEL